MTVRRAVAVVAVALVVAALCVVAGLWQWQRHQSRSAAVDLVTGNYDAAPVAVEALVGPDGALAAGDEWRPVTVVGRYVPGSTVLVRNRPVGGRPAVHVLGVLEVTDGPRAGSVLVVNRGWLPAADAGAAPAPPTGPVEVVVRLRPAEPPAERTAPPGQVYRIDVDEVTRVAGTPDGSPLRGVYGVLAAEGGAPPQGLVVLPRPELDLGTHLSYAFQWWVFALGALVGAAVLLRRDAGEAQAVAGDPRTGAGPGSAPPAPARAAGRSRSHGSGRLSRSDGRTRRPTLDEEEEDALVDAASPPHLSSPS